MLIDKAKMQRLMKTIGDISLFTREVFPEGSPEGSMVETKLIEAGMWAKMAWDMNQPVTVEKAEVKNERKN